MSERYEWDEGKAAANLIKHGVAFEAAEEFDWARAVVVFDGPHGAAEERWIATGSIGEQTYTMVFTRRGDKTRIISLRISNRKERMTHDQAKSETRLD